MKIRSYFFNTVFSISIAFSMTSVFSAPRDVIPEGMTEEQYQQMMSCFVDLDQTALNEIGDRAQDMIKEVDALCRADERKEAEKLALSFKEELDSTAEIQSIRNCGEMSGYILNNITLLAHYNQSEEPGHICDQ